MGQDHSPNRPRKEYPFIDKEGQLTDFGFQHLEQMWRQVAAGFVIVPCSASGTNAITLTPTLHSEGSRAYGNYMTFCAVAAATSTGLVTASVGALGFLKVYKTAGAAQATVGDIVSGSLYLFIYNSALDSAAGGFVLK